MYWDSVYLLSPEELTRIFGEVKIEDLVSPKAQVEDEEVQPQDCTSPEPGESA